MGKLRVLDLFSGIGGFSLGLERTGGFETVAFCEIEEFPRRVLAKHWPEVPIYPDVRKLKGADVGSVDVVCGGYPCQPFSTAGRRKGKEDDRHLWPEFSRLVAELRPTWVIGENVAGHISMGLDDVLSDLEGQGYACRTFVIPACAVGAHHRRDRCWTVANAGDVLQPRELDAGRVEGASSRGESGDASEGQASHRKRLWSEPSSSTSMVAHAEGERRGEAGASCSRRSKRAAVASSKPNHVANTTGKGQPNSCRRSQICERNGDRSFGLPSRESGGEHIWRPEPAVGRMVDGLPGRVDRLRALGNAVVPQIPEIIGHAILQAEAPHG